MNTYNNIDEVKSAGKITPNALINADCLDAMRYIEDGSVDSIITDPPYGLSFMGKDWDHGVPGIPFWEAALRVAKPGAFLLAFGGTRTFHRLAVAIEDAGWEIRDTVMWVYGSGFPKSHNVGKAIDKMQGSVREVVGEKLLWGHNAGSGAGSFSKNQYEGQTGITRSEPLTKGNSQWEGWGTALKPAWEPIIVARKPLIGTVAENVLKYGTGGMNIDGCRVGLEEDCRLLKGGTYGGNRGSDKGTSMFGTNQRGVDYPVRSEGRWPANVIHDGSDEVVGLFPQSNSCNTPSTAKPKSKFRPGQGNYQSQGTIYPGDSGSAARFFYCAKASKQDRDEGCEGLPEYQEKRTQDGGDDTRGRPIPRNRNNHPTVKPIALMRYLCKLVTPPNGIILDPFAGSGSTGKAAAKEDFKFIMIEKDSAYIDICKRRIAQSETLFSDI
jgi:DNA modification methylase